MIECTLQPIVSRYLDTDSNKPRYGVYLQSMYWGIKGYGKTVWVVGVKINLPDYDALKETYESDDDIVQKCVEFLNLPPKSKYGKKRKRKPLYSFDSTPYAYEIIDDKKGGKVISARLKTSERKNVLFWKSGPAA